MQGAGEMMEHREGHLILPLEAVVRLEGQLGVGQVKKELRFSSERSSMCSQGMN